MITDPAGNESRTTASARRSRTVPESGRNNGSARSLSTAACGTLLVASNRANGRRLARARTTRPAPAATKAPRIVNAEDGGESVPGDGPLEQRATGDIHQVSARPCQAEKDDRIQRPGE